MKKDVLINITSVSQTEADEPVEILTKGKFSRLRDAYYISYLESDDSGFSGLTTTLKVEGNKKVTLRRGKAADSMVIESGKRNVCRYVLPEGEIYFGVETDYIQNELTDLGGNLKFAYSLDMNAEPVNQIKLDIKIREV
jgi:uncharacterized beta-barrel protein YwiB (DUF1934 family)